MQFQSVRSSAPPPIFSDVGNTGGLKPAQQPMLLARSETGGNPNKGQPTTTPQFVQLMGKNPALRQVPYANYVNSIRSAGGMPQPERPGAAYFEVLNGPLKGKIIDISKEKYPGKFMSLSTKIDLMEYGFGQLGLKKIGNVTIDQFAKANTYYRATLADSGGSNTGAVRGALKAFEALGGKAFPNGPPKAMTFEDLNPWLKGEIRSGRMTLEKAIQITEAEADRRRTMETLELDGTKTCITHHEILDKHSENKVSTTVHGYTEGWDQKGFRRIPASSTSTAGKIYHPKTGEVVASQSHGGGIDGIDNRNGLSLWGSIEQTSNQVTPLPNPRVVVEGRCTFSNGMVMNSTVPPPSSDDSLGHPRNWIRR